MRFESHFYFLFASFLVLGIVTIIPSAFAATTQVAMTPGAGADESCEAAKNCFEPNVVYIAPGDTVTWTNNDKVVHTATSGQSSDNRTGTIWGSSQVKAGDTYSFTFQNVGTYDYHCMIHPWMTGAVIVGGVAPIIPPTPPPQPNPYGTEVIITQGAGSDQSCVSAQNCFSPSKLSIDAGQAVTWTNNDIVAHTTTSGHTSDNKTGTIWDSSLIPPAKHYSFTFSNPGEYPYFCMVHPWMTGEILVGGGATVQPISVTTDKPSYQAGDIVTITVQSQSLQPGQSVAVMVSDQSGNIISSRTLTISSQNSGSLQVGLPQTAQTGTYQVTATASVAGSLYKGEVNFTVNPSKTSNTVTIISVQATDQQGNTISSFGRGSTGYAKVVLSSQSSQTVLITVNLVGADSTSLGVGTIKMPLNLGQTEIVVSFFIPSSAATGSANIYADAFSDWPTNGGIPLTGEASSVVGIG